MFSHQPFRQLLYTVALLGILQVCECLPLDLSAQTPDPTIKVEGTPKVQLVPLGGSGSVWIRVTVPRDARNRVVCVVLDGTVYRSSCWENVGSGAVYRLEYGIRDLPAGEYVLVAELQWAAEHGERRLSYGRARVVIRNPSQE